LGLGHLCETSGVLRVAPPPWCSRPMRNRPAPAVGVPAGASAEGGPADRVGGREQALTGRMPGEAPRLHALLRVAPHAWWLFRAVSGNEDVIEVHSVSDGGRRQSTKVF
jgi:hypothetical protein